MRQRLVAARLMTLLRLMRISGDIAYQRHIGLTEMRRRVITLVGNFDGLSSAELVQLMGSDKAQISRTVKALTVAGLTTRAALRADIELTGKGRAMFEQVLAVARERDVAITKSIGKTELNRFSTITAELTDRSAHLLLHERQLSEESPPVAERLDADGKRPISRMTVPAVMTLVSYIRRGATVAYKRETGISQFEWQILSQIAEHQPITLAELIVLMARDKSHIGRTLRRLVDADLVSQQRVPGRRETVLTTTANGADIYAQMCTIAIRRDDFLFAEMKRGNREAYVATIEKLTVNAETMLREERRRETRAGA